MINIPQVKLGIVAVSRDCFPLSLSEQRRKAVAAACVEKDIEVYQLQTIIENENDVVTALAEAEKLGINSLVIYLGNFGPEGPLSIMAQRFAGPTMFAAAAEEATAGLKDARGDAYCGVLNASYSAGLRNLAVHIPEYPVGTATDVANMIGDFVPVARTILGLKGLKIFSFGPRPQDFVACNAPIKALFDLGVEIMENSELDLLDIYQAAEGHADIPKIVAEMETELGDNNPYPDLLPKLAQYEAALLDFHTANMGASTFGVFANKCWPSFEKFFGFVPCYVNARLAQRGIPVACEVDIYGALSEYMITCATNHPATLLDINNTVPQDMVEANASVMGNYTAKDLFMGFHCGNTAPSCMKNSQLRFQKIMHSLMEPGKEPDITRGTLEGQIKPGEVTLFRLQSTADTKLRAYVAQGDILDIDPQSFGAIAAFGIPEMQRFYRHVLVEKRYPHHAGIAFGHVAKTLYQTLNLLGVTDIDYNQPAQERYPNEIPSVFL
ncbi:L-fucose/L-arabinose isomerase family protein [Agarivorans sp. MS3-6]|uniref:L-fucose/L-arabinose isomerase family protein n=1 Tax=Agarivorans sp. TSD2052 TaxID=2937286 RepID=UPI00200D7F17|nr:fucose isomerase [Agarivorans sp. TSD2052]UPW17520.1 fucose isomerase [Agarivorans sp. TSD2052]